MKQLLRKIAEKSGLKACKEKLLGFRHLILNFHRLRSDHQPLDPFDSCPSNTIQQFTQAVLKTDRNYKIVSLEELAGNLNSIRPLAAITFDDGWRDTYDLAFPILKKMGIPAVVFVVTSKIGSKIPFWQQHLGNLFRMDAAHKDRFLDNRLRHHLQLNAANPIDHTTYRHEVWRQKQSTYPVCDNLEQSFSDLLESQYTLRCFVSELELLEMSNSCFSIGSHTHSHPLLDKLPKEMIISELLQSREIIESVCQQPCHCLAYPNGNSNAKIASLARQLGYKIACTVEPRHCGSKDDLWRLPRKQP